MFRLNDRQLHILLGIMFGASVAICAFFVWKQNPYSFISGKVDSLHDINEGWVASYETTDEDKLKKFGEDDNSKGKVITEVLNLPNDFATFEKVTLSQKLPDSQSEKLFIVFTTDGQHVKISVNKEQLYDNKESGDVFSYHIVEVPYEYRNGTLTIELYPDDKTGMIHFDGVKIGTFNELIWESLVDNGYFVIFGFILILTGVILLIVSSFIKVTKYSKKKRLLQYSSIEGIVVGALFMFESRLIRTLINWEFISYFVMYCEVTLTAVLHLLVLRCQIKKKRILSVIDFGILFFLIAFISGIVLQWFELITFEGVYKFGLILLGLCIFVYTLIMGTASYDYKQKDGRPVFAANIIFLIAAVIELVLSLAGQEKGINGLSLIAGVYIYFAVIWIYGIRKSVASDEKTSESENDEQLIRERVVEQFNPNLLFASFQTLQTLIKNDSKKSIKMIYYISVYVKNNLRAMSNQGEIISFEEELEHIMAYLQLQKVRSGNFGFMLECKLKDFMVPRNTIEPIVENAVQYGIAGKNNRGNVVVRSYEREDGYAIQIIDDGIGFDTAHLKKHSSTSLKNLMELLESICKAQCEIISKEGKGTVVTVILPVLDNDLLKHED